MQVQVLYAGAHLARTTNSKVLWLIDRIVDYGRARCLAQMCPQGYGWFLLPRVGGAALGGVTTVTHIRVESPTSRLQRELSLPIPAQQQNTSSPVSYTAVPVCCTRHDKRPTANSRVSLQYNGSSRMGASCNRKHVSARSRFVPHPLSRFLLAGAKTA